MSKPNRPKPPKANTEQTSDSIASIAGRMLNGRALAEAENWLLSLVLWDTTINDVDRSHALTLLGALPALKKLAGSTLTQAPNQKR